MFVRTACTVLVALSLTAVPAATLGTSSPASAAVAVTATPAVVSTVVAPLASASPLIAPATAAPTSAAAKRAKALETALAQIGKPYRYGATGPSSFDCSGLTSFAFKNAGVSIPRTSRAQSTIGTPVAKADLQPGDLVFFYRPVSHVAIYIGNGQVVHASTSGQPVKISNLDNMPFSGARRV